MRERSLQSSGWGVTPASQLLVPHLFLHYCLAATIYYRHSDKVTNLIRLLPEPKRLILAWQSSRDGSSRRRWEVGELTREYVSNDAPVTFRYYGEDRLAGALAEGFDGYPAFRLKHGPFSSALETFMRRLPPRKRADFPRYLQNFRVDPEAEFTDFALLGISEAKLPSDGFSIVDPLDNLNQPMQFLTEAVGYRHLANRPIPLPDDPVTLAFEPTNLQDPDAITFSVCGQLAGWVNRLQTCAFRHWLHEGRIRVSVDRVNGTPDHPRLYLMVHVAEPTARPA